MTSNRAVTALLLIAALAFVASPAAAQYMFLDTNGDGFRTSADHLVNGANTVNVYLDSNHNRDGSLATCDVDGTSPLNINAYYVNLSGTNVTYTLLTNQMGASFGIHFATRNPGDGTLQDGYASSSTFVPAGRYRLASLTITASAGAVVNIVDVIPNSPVTDYTAFGTGPGGCLGNDFDNTYKLAGPGGGSDWTDVDGLGPTEGLGPPVLAAIGNKTVNEGNCLTFTATAFAPNGNPVTFFLTGQPPAGASITTGGQFNWCPTEAQGPGVYAVTVTVLDNVTQFTDTETIQVTVNEVNVAPVITNPGNKTVNELSLLSFTVTATDADLPAQTRTFSLGAGAPAGAAITAGGAFTWTPTEAQGPGSYPITINVSDGMATVGTSITVTVNEVNLAPVLAAIGNKTVTAGNTLAFTATATDADLPANTLTFSLDPGAPVGAAITSGGNFTWTPTQSQAIANYLITIRVTDNGVPALSDAKSFAVYVPQGEIGPPIVTDPGNKTVNEGECLDFTIAATSAGGGTLTFVLGAGAPSGASISSLGGQFIWCPTEAQGPGNYAITVHVSDGFLTTSTIFTVTVLEVNLAPVLNPIGNKTAPLGTLLTFTATATDADLPANTRTFSLDPGAPAGATIGAASGVFSWTPAASGTFPVTIRVTDNGTPPLSDSETILITPCLGCGTTPPVLGAIGNKTVNELALLSFTATATDADPALTLTFTLGAGNPAGSAITAGGAFTWTPTEAQGPGVYPITVVVTDNGIGNLSDSETIRVTVLEVNQAPVLNPIGNKTASLCLPVTFTATATDADLPANALTFSIDPGAPPGATINPVTGAFSWTPQAGGTFPFTIRVTDNGSPPLSDSENILIAILLGPQPPVLQQPGNMTVTAGLTADQMLDATDQCDTPLSFSKVSGPAFVTVTTLNPTTGNVHLAPAAADVGSYTVTVAASNGLLFDQKTFTVTVTPNEALPVLQPIANMTVDEGAIGTQTILGTDPDNAPLTFVKISGPFWVLVETTSPTTGLVTATPDFSSGGSTYTVTVRATNGTLYDQQSFTIYVNEVCQTPLAEAGGPYTGQILLPVEFDGNESSDPDGNLVSFIWDFGDGSTGSGATVSHAYTATGTYSALLTVANGCGVTDSDQTTVTITDCHSTLAFVVGGNKQINLQSGKPTWCVQVEALDYDVTEIDLSSIVLRSEGTGSVEEIHALSDKTSVGGDRNGNGLSEITACFRKDDLRQLFSNITGTQQIQVSLTGNILGGGTICAASLTISVKGSGGAIASSISPNPLNPSAMLTFQTQERGPVLVQLFDVRGRLLRTLLDESDGAAGYHDVRIDGTTASGTRLSSGVYFVRIRAGVEEERKAITILK